jgi:predicted PolB exonuclease-like 3'-5' exonuclease
MNVMVFDIETIPDVEGGRRLYGLEGLDDKDVAQVMFTKRREQTGDSEFLPLHLHRVVAISVVLRSGDNFKVWSLGDLESDEKEIVTRFFDGIDRYSPTLVSWNGSGFDLPVLHYRCLVHGIAAPRYWDTGDDDRDFRWNNYLNRFHSRHTDLMDVLAGYQGRGAAPLDQVATLLGLPGKMGMSGAHVWDQYQAGELGAIRDYCETDVLNTYLVYLRWEVVRGNLSQAAWLEECQRVRETMREEGKPHLDAFLEAWPEPRA